ncbi:MAG: LysR family transcriptional regulator, partial [Mailhella sp.]
MTLRQFEYFLKIADCGSFNKAAQMLSMSQQSLQSSVNSFEKQLGFTVFVRSRNGICLTL